jgi:hypothetical protein
MENNNNALVLRKLLIFLKSAKPTILHIKKIRTRRFQPPSAGGGLKALGTGFLIKN